MKHFIKNNITYKTLAAGIVAVALMSSPSLNACHWWDAPCKAREAAKKAAAAAKAAADKAAAEAKAAADKAAAEAKAAADKAAAEAKAAADKAADSAHISREEAAVIISKTVSAYSFFSSGMVQGYETSISNLNRIYNSALEALFREAGRLAIGQQRQFLEQLQYNMNHLDQEGTEALNRLIRAFPKLNAHGMVEAPDYLRNDLTILADKLGMLAGKANTIIPRGLENSSFGVVLGVNGADVVGVEGSYSVMRNILGPEKNAVMDSLGGSLGASIGAEVMVGIVWVPGPIDTIPGANVGFGVSGALEVGAGVGLSWSVSKGMSGAWNAMPSFTLSFDTGAEVSAAFQGGYTAELIPF